MIKYYKLLDPKNYNTVVKADGKLQFKYIKGKGWLRSGIMIQYFSDESDTYDMYEEITEQEALNLIN